MATAIEEQFARAVPSVTAIRQAIEGLGEACVKAIPVIQSVFDALTRTPTPEVLAALDKIERERRAIARFRRTMRRLERRARVYRNDVAANVIRAARLNPGDGAFWLADTARILRDRRFPQTAIVRRGAYLRERVADAVARYRAEVS